MQVRAEAVTCVLSPQALLHSAQFKQGCVKLLSKLVTKCTSPGQQCVFLKGVLVYFTGLSPQLSKRESSCDE